MPVTAIECKFVDKPPGRPEGRRTYPAGTPVTFCPPGNDDEGAYLAQRVKELTRLQGEVYRIVLLDGVRRLLPQSMIVPGPPQIDG